MNSFNLAILISLVIMSVYVCVDVVLTMRLKRRKEENDSTRKISGEKVNKESD